MLLKLQKEKLVSALHDLPDRPNHHKFNGSHTPQATVFA